MNSDDFYVIDFIKMSGAGNDFIAIDNRGKVITEYQSLARSVCDRRLGIGADGLLLLEASNRADFEMRYFNSDGSTGGMCGNGGRCIARYANIIGVITSNRFRFEAFGYIYAVEIGEDAVKLSMKDAKIFSLDRVLDIEGQKVKYNYLDTGSPHAVIFWDQNDFQRSASYDEYNIETIGRRIRNHKCFEHGVNVNFVYQIDTTTLKNRTYERGVESETMACGTGSVASAIAAAETGRINLPVSIETRSKRTLRIDGEREINGNWRKITLSGPAEEIFRGQFKVNARTNILQAI